MLVQTWVSWQFLFCHGHRCHRHWWGSWQIQVECLWAVELISTRGCWTMVGKESKKGGSFGTFEDCMVDLGWGVGECMGVSRFDGLVVCKFRLSAALLGKIGGRPSHIREWFVVCIGVGLAHIRLMDTVGDEDVVSKIGGGEFVVVKDLVG